MTPEERDALVAKLTNPTTNPSTTGQALADKLRDPSSGLAQGGGALGRVMTSPGALMLTGGPAAMGAHYASDALAKKLTGVDPNKPYEAPKAPDKTTPADWTPGSPLKEMPTDPVAVKAAMTLDPKYAGLAQRGAGGVGGAGGTNPLKLTLDDAHRRQLGTIGAERAFVEDLGEAKVNRIGQQSELDQQEAARQLQAAEQQRQIDEAAHAKMQGYLERNQKRADEIGAMKVDPHRLMRDATAGQQVAMAIGQMLGGALAARQGGGVNQFQAHLDKAIDRDIQAQMSAIENKKTAIQESRSIFGQMLQETGDFRQASNEYRAQIYRAAQMSLKGRSDALGIPEAKANAELASNAIQQKLDGLSVQNAETAWKQYQAQAAAAAAAQKAAADEAWKRTMQIEELKLKAGQLRVDEIKAGKEGGKEDQAAINEATKRLNEDAIVGTDPVLKSMESHRRPDGSIVGFDTASRAKVGALKGITANLLPENVYSKLALSGEERTSRLDLERLAKMYQHEVTGAGGSKEEMEDIRRAFAGVHDEASLNHAINLARKTVDTRKANATAVLSDDQKRELARRQTRDGQKAEMPTSVRAK